MAVRELTEAEARDASGRVEQAVIEEVMRGLEAAERGLAWSRQLLEYLAENKTQLSRQ